MGCSLLSLPVGGIVDIAVAAASVTLDEPIVVRQGATNNNMFCGLSNWGNCKVSGNCPGLPVERIATTEPPSRSRSRGVWIVFLPMLFVVNVVAAGPSVSADPAIDANLLSGLGQSFRGTLTGRPIRQALGSIADTSRVNLWFDPRCDPGVPVDLTQNRGSVWRALVAAADCCDLVVAPSPSCVVVSTPDRIDRLLAVSHRTGFEQRVDVSWPLLTTPNDAIEILTGLASRQTPIDPRQVRLDLPHDLLPAVSMRKVDPIAIGRLVRATYTSDPSSIVPPAVLMYPARVVTRLKRRGIGPATDWPSNRSGRELIGVRDTWSSHRRSLTAWIETEPPPAEPASAPEKLFSLKVRTRAVDVIDQLAGAMRMSVTWSPEVFDRRDGMVQLDAKDRTLRELVEQVADEIGATVVWGADSFRLERDESTVTR